MSKRFTLVLVLVLATSGLMVVKPAQSAITKPSVPKFTVKLSVNNTIELKIKNQPFDKNNIYNYSFVYNVRIRTDDENWTDLYDAEDGYPTQSNLDYTVLSYMLGESAYYPPADYPLAPSMKVGILPTSGQVDFQVEAMIGYRDRGVYSNGIMPYVFKGEKSGWSNTQTITIDGSASTTTPTASPSQYPTATPDAHDDADQQGFNWTEISLFAALGVIAALLAVIALMHRKQTKK